MKRLAIVTGSRAEWGVLKTFAALAVNSSTFGTSIIAAGMHLLPEYGNTIEEIRADGFDIATCVSFSAPSTTSTQNAADSLGKGVRGFSRAFRELKLDMILVFGDRVEPLAATLAAAYINIPIAHDGGGDITATIDNPTRHAISRYASLCTVATKDARDRLIQYGCDPANVHVTGSLAIDGIRLMEWRSREETLADLGLPAGSRYLLVAFHPEPEHADRAGEWMDNVMRACLATGLYIVATYPNSDPGSQRIIDRLLEHCRTDSLDRIKAFPSLGRTRYLHALKYADALVGNSSSGLYEAPSLRVPVVNVGRRQEGRLKAANVADCGYTFTGIRDALGMVLYSETWGDAAEKAVNPYGDGHAAERMLEIVEMRLGE